MSASETSATGGAEGRLDRRARLLAAGVSLYGEIGFDRITVDVVAERAGVARGLVTYYFGSKQGFFREVSEQFVLLLQTTQTENHSSDPAAWLEADVNTFLALVEAHPMAMRNTTAPGRTPRGHDSAMSAFTVDRILHILGDCTDDPLLRTVVTSWGFHSLDLALRWIDQPGIARADIAAVIIADLRAALATIAAAHPEFGLPAHPFAAEDDRAVQPVVAGGAAERPGH